MTRLLVHVEGETEEEFVNEVLGPHLYSCGYTEVSARLVGRARLRRHRGGICGWGVAMDEIYKHLAENGDAYATTLVDFYGLPQSGSGCWPGRDRCAGRNPSEQSGILLQAMMESVEESYQGIANRFVPFVTMHEFEGLLFSNPEAMADGIGLRELAPQFQDIRDQFDTPEHINDSPRTAPSKRIIDLVPGYEKPLYGNLAALSVTLSSIRDECEVFDDWVRKLESLVP